MTDESEEDHEPEMTYESEEEHQTGKHLFKQLYIQTTSSSLSFAIYFMSAVESPLSLS